MRWLAGLAAILISGTFALADGGRVWVAPFTDVNGTQQQADWISRALRQSVAGKAPTPASAAGTLARTGMYEGSDLQRALEDRDYLRRLQQQSEYQPPPTYTYTQPVYPATYGLNGSYYPPYGGYGGGYWWGG